MSVCPTVRVPDERGVVTDFAELMKLKEQSLRTRVMFLEWSIHDYLNTGDQDKLARTLSNDWMHTIGDMMSDPFTTIRLLAKKREDVQHDWSQEVKALHAAGYSLRTIADVAGVSHDTVWRKVK